MKNRKTVVIAFMLIAAMLLGVGYAALTDIFVIAGTAEVGLDAATTYFDEKIFFSAAEATSTTNPHPVKADTASVSSTDNDNATFSVNSLALAGHSATFTFTIKNESEFDAIITIKTPASQNTGFFSTSMSIPTEGIEIKANSSVSFTVTTTLIQNVTEAVNASTTIELIATTTD